MGLVGVIADDLTGAMDAGMQLIGKNLRICTALTAEDLESVIDGADVVVVNTQSRNIDPQQAYGNVKAVVRQLVTSGCQAWYKKIDSTLRGNVGAEIKAVLDSQIFDLVIVAPALPFNKRTTVGGIHFVDGVKLAEIELAKDPFAPIYHSAIAEIINSQFAAQIGHLELAAVREGGKALAQKAAEYLAFEVKIVVADAESEQDLHNIATAARLLPCKTLLCGSAGLFQYLDEAYPIPASQGDQTTGLRMADRREDAPAYSAPDGAPVLVLSGSPAQMSKKQIRYLDNRRQDTVVISFDITEVPEAETGDSIEQVISNVLGHLQAGRNVVLDAAGVSKEFILKRTQGNSQQLDYYSSLVQKLVRDTAIAAARTRLSALVFFGGDTAVTVLKALGGKGIAIAKEVEPYIPLGRLIGGAYSGLPVVTKAGGFGNEQSLIRILELLDSLAS